MPRLNLEGTIEFIRDKIYLGAFDYVPEDTDSVTYFTVENALFYNQFHLDFGPMNIGSLYRFAVIFHEILNDPENRGKAIVFYSSTSSKMRSNAACMLCLYMVLVQSWTPHQVLQPLAQVDPPFMPFRDAGYSNADFEITIQDVVYGVWRAKERGIVDITNFNLEEYEKYERVENGDFNVISKDFIAFASPQEDKHQKGLNMPFRNVLDFFKSNDVQLVVRLNSHLYNKKHFEHVGIQHTDMIFDDGTCPEMDIVTNFVGMAESVIRKGGKIAVHCKAGLGRTGCLIGAHLIYTYGFTANECIGFMRFVRPGMVVGPQQHWLYLHQNEFREWKYTMRLDPEPSKEWGGLHVMIPYDEYKRKIRSRRLDHDGDYTVDSVATPRARCNSDDHLKVVHAVPSDSPGQPRKSPGRNGIEQIDRPVYDNNSDFEDEKENQRKPGRPRGRLSSGKRNSSGIIGAAGVRKASTKKQ